MVFSAIMQKHRAGTQQIATRNADALANAALPKYRAQNSAASAGASNGIFGAISQGLGNLAEDVMARERAGQAVEAEAQRQKHQELQAQQNLAYEMTDAAHEQALTQQLEAVGLTAKDEADYDKQTDRLVQKFVGQFGGRSRDEQVLAEHFARGRVSTARFDYAKKQYELTKTRVETDARVRAEQRLADLGSVAYAGNAEKTAYESAQLRGQIATMVEAGMLSANEASGFYADIEKTLIEQGLDGEFDRTLEGGVEKAMSFVQVLRENENIPAELRTKMADDLQRRLARELRNRDSVAREQERTEKEAVNKAHGEVYAQTFQRLDDGEPVPLAEVSELLANREISEPQHRALRSAIKKGTGSGDTDVLLWSALNDSINEKGIDLNTLSKIIEGANMNGQLTLKDTQALLKRVEAVESGLRNDDDARFLKMVHVQRKYLNDSQKGERDAMGRFVNQADRERWAEDNREFEERIAQGENAREVANEIVERHRRVPAKNETVTLETFLPSSQRGEPLAVIAAYSKIRNVDIIQVQKDALLQELEEIADQLGINLSTK